MKIISITKRKDFINATEHGKKAIAKGLILQTLCSEEQSQHIRIGYTASKKLGNAVARNRAKRRLRALVAEIMPDRAKLSHDYVLIGRKATLDRDFADLAKDLKFALHNTDTHI